MNSRIARAGGTLLLCLIGMLDVGQRAAEAAESPEAGPWKTKASLGLNMTQGTFSTNWRGGGQGSFAWVVTVDAEAVRQMSRKFNWSNSVQLAYGQTSLQVDDPDNPGEKVWDTPDKSSDMILVESVGRFTLGGFVDPFAAVRLDSQFRDVSNPLGTLVLNPIKLTETAGLARVLAQEESTLIVTRFGLGVRQTFSSYFTGVGTQTARTTTNDGGFDWTTDIGARLLSNRVAYRGKLQFFLPVFFNNSGTLEDFDRGAAAADSTWEPVADYWQDADVNFQNTFVTAVSKMININLVIQFVYDKYDAGTHVGDPSVEADRETVRDGVRKSGQFRESLAIVLTYKLF